MKTFTEPNCNLCMQGRLTILKMLCDKRVTVMNKNSEIYGDCRHKTTFPLNFLSTDEPIFNGCKGQAVNGIFKSYDLKPSTVVFKYW